MKICSFNGCRNICHAKGFCSGHYQQHHKGRVLTPLTFGQKGRPRKHEGPTHNGPDKKDYFKLREQERRDKKSPLPPDDHSGTCDICGCVPTKLKADHDHTCHTAKQFPCELCLRGFLCHKCNLGLGMFDDDEDRLIAALLYLREHKERNNASPNS